MNGGSGSGIAEFAFGGNSTSEFITFSILISVDEIWCVVVLPRARTQPIIAPMIMTAT